MTLYEIFLISIKEQAPKKRTVGTHTKKKNVHNKKNIVYKKVKHYDDVSF